MPTTAPLATTVLLSAFMGLMTLDVSWKTAWRSLKKLKLELPYGPAVPLLGTSDLASLLLALGTKRVQFQWI